MNMPDANLVPFWAEVVVAVLLVIAGIFSLAGAIGILRFKDFFQRMHPPALAYTLGAWCVTLACILFFSMAEEHLALHAWLIIIFLAITMPVTTILLARAALFRKREAGEAVPPAFYHAPNDPAPNE